MSENLLPSSGIRNRQPMCYHVEEFNVYFKIVYCFKYAYGKRFQCRNKQIRSPWPR